MAEVGAKKFAVFRVTNHDFTPKNDIFSNFGGGGAHAGCAPSESAPAKSVKQTKLKRHRNQVLSPKCNVSTYKTGLICLYSTIVDVEKYTV